MTGALPEGSSLPFELPILKPLAPLYFVGDSNTLLYRYLTFDLPDYFARPIVTNACFVKGITCATIMDGPELHPEIIAFFYRDHVLEFKERWIRYSRVALSNEDRKLLLASRPPLHDIYNHDNTLAVVLMVGALDLAAILGQIGTGVDFALDDPRYRDAAFVEPHLPVVPVAIVRELVDRRIAPLREALRRFREMGFDDVYVHSLHPPTLDDVRYFRARQIQSSAKVRYKVAILVNQALERAAAESGTRFLDMWAQTTLGGLIDPALDLDGDHLNRASAALTIRAVLVDVLRHGSDEAI